MLNVTIGLPPTPCGPLEHMGKESVELFIAGHKVHTIKVRILGGILLEDFGKEGQDAFDHGKLVLVHRVLFHGGHL